AAGGGSNAELAGGPAAVGELRAAGQPAAEQPARVGQERDVVPQGSGRADHGPVLVDPPAALAVAGDRRRIYAARTGREVEAVPVRAADAQPGFRAGHVHSAGHRVEEVAEAAAPGGAESF